jgi:hypothetical protein
MLIPRPLCGEANAKEGVIEHEIDDTLWAAVEPTVVAHFAVVRLVHQKGKGRDKRPTSGLVVKRDDHQQTIPYNYLIFSISRYEGS